MQVLHVFSASLDTPGCFSRFFPLKNAVYLYLISVKVARVKRRPRMPSILSYIQFSSQLGRAMSLSV